MSDDKNIYIKQRNAVPLVFTFTENGTAINLSGKSVWFMVKNKWTDADTDAIISKLQSTHTTPASGVTTITLTEADLTIAAKNYLYEVGIIDTNGEPRSADVGMFIVEPILKGVV